MAKTTVKAVLQKSKWGPIIDFEGRMAFLDYPGKADDLEIGKEYNCQMYWRIMYSAAEHPYQGNKEWAFLDAESLTALQKRPEFTSFNLKIEDACPHFMIIQ